MTFGFRPRTLHCSAIRSEEEVFPLEDGPASITIFLDARFSKILSAMCAYPRSCSDSAMLISSTAFPDRIFRLSVATFSMPTMAHQSEYSFNVVAILLWRRIGITFVKSFIVGGCRQNPSPMPVMSKIFRQPVEGTRGPWNESASPSR